jgi:serine/threonine protein kinase
MTTGNNRDIKANLAYFGNKTTDMILSGNYDKAFDYYDITRGFNNSNINNQILGFIEMKNINEALRLIDKVMTVMPATLKKGGFGSVIVTGQKSVVKIATANAIEHLKREDEHLQASQCENVIGHVSSHVVEERKTLILLMRKVQHTLKDLMDNNKLFRFSACQVMKGLLTGLHHVHRQGIVHCDIKPSNIGCDTNYMSRAENVKILDFGASIKIGEVIRARTEGYSIDIIATPAADIYSAGIVLAQYLLASNPPSGKPNNKEHPLKSIIIKATARSANARYKDALEFLRDIEQVWKQNELDCVCLQYDLDIVVDLNEFSETVTSIEYCNK